MNPITATKLINGGWEISAIIDGYRVSVTYFYASKREAIAQFKKDNFKTGR